MAPRCFRAFVAALCAGAGLSVVAAPAQASSPFSDWTSPFAPCRGTCEAGLFTGPVIKTGLERIVTRAIGPWDWGYSNDYIVGGSVSRPVVTLFRVLRVEPEVGFAQRFGKQHEQEAWGAIYLRYTAFPWNRYVATTAAINTGLSYASAVSAIEDARGGRSGGHRLQHYLGPELTFALPSHPGYQLAFRIHHRSGAYGLVSNTTGGDQYATVGFKIPL